MSLRHTAMSLKEDYIKKLHRNNGFIWNLDCDHFFFQQIQYFLNKPQRTHEVTMCGDISWWEAGSE